MVSTVDERWARSDSIVAPFSTKDASLCLWEAIEQLTMDRDNVIGEIESSGNDLYHGLSMVTES